MRFIFILWWSINPSKNIYQIDNLAVNNYELTVFDKTTSCTTNISFTVEEPISINYSGETNFEIGSVNILDNENVIIIVERKTISDLVCSIKDGRHKEQKLRLMSNYPIDKIYYLVVFLSFY